MEDVDVIEDAQTAATLLGPWRAQILATLAEPGSATTVAARLGLPRQRVNYHLRALEEAGLVRLVEERPRRGLTERVVVATARSYAVSPRVFGAAGPDPAQADRLSTGYLLAVAARLLAEVGSLARGARRAGRPLATLTLDTEIRFGTSADRAAFTAELTEAVHRLAARYHDESAPGGRWHRLVVAGHPLPAPAEPAPSPALLDPPAATPLPPETEA